MQNPLWIDQQPSRLTVHAEYYATLMDTTHTASYGESAVAAAFAGDLSCETT